MLRVGLRDPADFARRSGNQPGRDARRLENGGCEERCRRLAISAGDTHDTKFQARVAVPPRGRRGERPAGIVHDDLRQQRARERPLHDRSGGAQSGRGDDEIVTVGVGARNRHEDRPRRHAAGVEGHPTHHERSRSLAATVYAGLGQHDGSEPSSRLEPFDELTQAPRGRRLAGTCPTASSGRHSAASSATAGAWGRPRTLRIPWRHAPTRSCTTCAAS